MKKGHKNIIQQNDQLFGFNSLWHKRNISLFLSEKSCSKIIFRIYNKTYVALGIKNDSDGYELRNELFKGSNTPKDITTIKNSGKKVAVFEGSFDFLSLISLLPKKK